MLLFFIFGFVVFLLLVIVIVRSLKARKTDAGASTGAQLYVGNLSYHANSHHLKEFFSQYGDLENVRVIKNNRTGRSKGFAFVTFRTAADANKALSSNGQSIKGRPIVVRLAKAREE